MHVVSSATSNPVQGHESCSVHSLKEAGPPWCTEDLAQQQACHSAFVCDVKACMSLRGCLDVPAALMPAALVGCQSYVSIRLLLHQHASNALGRSNFRPSFSIHNALQPSTPVPAPALGCAHQSECNIVRAVGSPVHSFAADSAAASKYLLLRCD